MLLDTIQRMQVKAISLVSIDSLKASGRKVPPQIHSVPALMIMPAKQLLFGKQVFDYLLLPGKGVLTNGSLKASSGSGSSGGGQQPEENGDPLAFTLNISNHSSDNFSFIEEDNADKYRNYTWSSIDDNVAQPPPADISTVSLQSNTRVKKETLDLEEFKARRAEDLTVIVNTNVTPPPVNTY